MKKCAKCGVDIKSTATKCFSCGTTQPTPKWAYVLTGIIFLAIIIGIVLLFSGGGTKTTVANTATATIPPSQAPTDTPTPSIPQEQIVANYKDKTETVSVSDVAKDPNNYQDIDVKFSGSILSFANDSYGNPVAANVSDPNDISSIIQITFSPFAQISNINKGDIITFWGKGQGVGTGKNAFGATIQEGIVKEVYMDDNTSSYNDTVDPNPNKE